MYKEELHDVFVMAAELFMIATLCILLVNEVGTARTLYRTREQIEDTKYELASLSKDYFLEHGEKIIGADVIEFVLRNNVENDYYFVFSDGTTFELTEEVIRNLYDAGAEFTYLWSQDYLTNTVFRDSVYKEFDVVKTVTREGRAIYNITQKGEG